MHVRGVLKIFIGKFKCANIYLTQASIFLRDLFAVDFYMKERKSNIGNYIDKDH